MSSHSIRIDPIYGPNEIKIICSDSRGKIMRKTHGARQNIEGLFKRLEQGYETVRQWPKFMIYLSLSLRFYPQPSTNSNLTQSN